MNDGSLSVSNMLHRELGIGKGEGGGWNSQEMGQSPNFKRVMMMIFIIKDFCVLLSDCEPS